MNNFSITTPVDREKVWRDLKRSIEMIYGDQQVMTTSTYMQLYTPVCDFSTRSTPGNTPSGDAKRYSGARSAGNDLYVWLKDLLRHHFATLFSGEDHLSNEDILACYSGHWQLFQFTSKVLTCVFTLYNQHWVARERKNDKHVMDRYQLSMTSWKESFFSLLHAKVTKARLKLIELERTGELNAHTQRVAWLRRAWSE